MTETNPQATSRAAVLMPALVEEAFDYLVPVGTSDGALVEATLASRALVGVVWGDTLIREETLRTAHTPTDKKPFKLKAVTRVIDDIPPFKPEFRAWMDWVSNFTLAPKGAVLSLCGLAHAAKTTRKKYVSPEFAIALPTLTTGQQAVVEELAEGMQRATPSPIRGEDGRGALDAHDYPLAQTLAHARALRQTMTDAETKLWQQLRRENLGVKFRKQHPIGSYIVDFICLELKLIVELDGGQHAEEAAQQRDKKRTAFFESQGFKVIRFWNDEVLQQLASVLAVIDGEVRCLMRPHPNPPPSGEGMPARHPMKPILLDGVTGSGKTEVYFHLIAEAMAQQAQVVEAAVRSPSGEPLAAGAKGARPPFNQILVLLPEIALTHQWLERFEKTFGGPPVVWHSRMTPAAKARAWQAVARGEAPIVVGARSALFLPFANLKLIIVDEEHDPSYKQEEGVLYHARDMAVARAHFEQIPILLVSATPSLETMENVRDGKYRVVKLPERFGAAGLPTVRLVDMRINTPERGSFIAPSVKAAMLETLARGEQVLFFMNRRGYAPLLLCRTCGHRFQCAHCSAWLVVHGRSRLECHHCGHKEAIPNACPSCNADADKLAPCGPGVERIAQEVREMFVQSRVESRESSKKEHIAPSSMPSTHEAVSLDSRLSTLNFPSIVTLSSDESINAETWASIEAGEVDILVGTQMVAKGHNFPRLTLVVVVDADVGLDGADLRAGERSYQLLHQLGGRAGRGDLAGTVLVQTYCPEHPVMKALVAHDRNRLMALEAKERKLGGWPPFGQLAAILLDGVDEAKVRAAAQMLARTAPLDARMKVLGPAPAPLSKLRGQYRYRILIKADKTIGLQATLRQWLKGQKFSGVRIKVDVNPYYFM